MIGGQKSGLLMRGAAVAFCSIFALSQRSVDTTGPIRERTRIATAGQASSIGRKLPVQIAVEVHAPSSDAKGATEVDFVLTNSGKRGLLLPISPNPGDLEPADPKVSYAVKHLNLYVTLDKRQVSVLAGGAKLYGNLAFPGTVITLAPGESIRVRARVDFPAVSAENNTNAPAFVAHAVLNDEVIRTVDGQTFEETQEVGSAVSDEYSPKSLFKSPE